MSRELSEVDMVIHFMRQSKMDAVRRELERLYLDGLQKNPSKSMTAQMKFNAIKELFRKASNNAPMP